MSAADSTTTGGDVTPKDIIWDCLNHYAYEDALFLAECYFSQAQSDEAVHIIATAYYRSGRISAAYILLQRYGAKSWRNKYLLARCCEDLNKLKEAEEVLREFLQQYSCDRKIADVGLSETIPHALSMLGRIYFKTDRNVRAKECWEKSLALSPFLWSSFERLCKATKGNLKAGVTEIFNYEKLLKRKEIGLSVTFKKENLVSKTPGYIERSGTPNLTVLKDTPTCEQGNSVSVADTETPSPLNAEVTSAAVAPPKAPRKASSKQKFVQEDEKRVTRRQSSKLSVLTQNQAQWSPRRSARLFHQNSVKENADSRSLRSAIRKPKPKKSLDCDINKLNEINKEVSKTRQFIVPPTNKQPETVAVTVASDNTDNSEDSCNSKPAATLLEALAELGKVSVASAHHENSAALELLESLPEMLRKTPFSLMAVARCHFQAADYRKAVEVFEICHRSFEHYLEGIELYSTALWQLQMEMELSSLAQELTERFRDAPQTWCVVGNCFSLQKEHDSAIKFFQRATQLDPHFVYAYTLLGHEYFAVEDYDKATQAFRTAVRLDPTHFNGWYGLGLISYKNEQLPLANVYFRRALEINSKSSVLLCHLSVVQQALSRSEDALKLLNRALSLSDDPLCRYHKAQLLFSENRLEEALEELNILKLMVPREANVFFLLGKVHKKRGDTHLALINFSRATELDPRGEQHNPLIGDRRYDEEPSAFVEEAEGRNSSMDSDEAM